MNKISIYIPLLMLASCAAEEAVELESPVDNDTPRIVVFGGSTAPGVTRADNFPEPSNIGVCNANKLRILQFRRNGYPIESGNLKLTVFFDEKGNKRDMDIDLKNQLNYRDKWTNHAVTLNFPGAKTTGYAFQAIAFTDTDDDAFDLPNSSEDKYTFSTLKVKNAEYTPELYFGRLKPANDNYTYSSEEGYFYKYNGGASTTTNCQLEGSLYRIVSQLNVNIFDINPAVQKLEMCLSNVPIRINLYAQHRSGFTDHVDELNADHGYFYPVYAASDISPTTTDHWMTKTKVCSASEFKDGSIRLSTFLLPSTQGRTVTIEATIKKPYTVKEEYVENDVKHYRDVVAYKDTVISRTLRAAKNYNLDTATSRVYFSDKELPVYKVATNEFMSYSNVRVNVSGSFSDIFSEQSESNVEIEICPNYDAVHDPITIN